MNKLPTPKSFNPNSNYRVPLIAASTIEIMVPAAKEQIALNIRTAAENSLFISEEEYKKGLEMYGLLIK